MLIHHKEDKVNERGIFSSFIIIAMTLYFGMWLVW
jgi:hypothetical protein